MNIRRVLRRSALLICMAYGHRPAARRYRSEERDYARCTRCGSDVVRVRGEDWSLPPRGMRVVWLSQAERDERAARGRPSEA